MGGTAYFLDGLVLEICPSLKMKKRKYLTRTPLTLDVRVIFLKLKTVWFARLKVNGPKSVSCMNLCFCKSIQILIHFVLPVFKRLQVVSIRSSGTHFDCPDLTSTHVPHLFKNTKPGLSATSKESLEMCSKKSKRNNLIFIVWLHYALSIYNAFRRGNNSKYKPIKFNFHTFPELEDIFTGELEYD
jgi:hypothetical protein